MHFLSKSVPFPLTFALYVKRPSSRLGHGRCKQSWNWLSPEKPLFLVAFFHFSPRKWWLPRKEFPFWKASYHQYFSVQKKESLHRNFSDNEKISLTFLAHDRWLARLSTQSLDAVRDVSVYPKACAVAKTHPSLTMFYRLGFLLLSKRLIHESVVS